ncbi:GDSL-like lipase/acylhydrolase domain protein [Calothrix sp. NIES-4071]|nr:GDSL-like lipase/acylhydrolase domain protein [Calothrix sp. NIES-4071]BAZ55682.1 GDSL-like lipase/acylhydrolase domain protein [Calothrix sp. NIES-4105]
MKILIFISTSLNLLVFILVCVLTIKNGGFTYWRQKIFSLNIFSKKANIFDIYNPPYYIHKTSQFELLPIKLNTIIFLGDSITDEGEWTELLQNFNIQNRGISGDTTERILRRLDVIIKNHPKQIFLMVGINDLHMLNKSVEATLLGYKQILMQFQEKLPNTEVFIQSVLPVNNNIYIYWTDNQKVIDLNGKLQDLATQYKYKYIDIYSHLLDTQEQLSAEYTSDGLHLNGKAYLIWKQIIASYC